MGGIAFADRGGREVGGWHGVNDNMGGGVVGLATQADGTGVIARHGHGAVRASGVLLIGSEASWACPAI